MGGARTALFNWLFARRHGGTFILRIEDTDEARNTEPAMRAIFDGLRWLGLDWDEGPEAGGDHGPYHQSQRRSLYESYLGKLEQAGRTYEDNGAIRFRFSREPITIPDLVCGETKFQATEEPDMTIRRPDGSYIFHFVNVVDDIEMEITHVIRGEDHLSNTWKHMDLFRALGEEPPHLRAHSAAAQSQRLEDEQARRGRQHRQLHRGGISAAGGLQLPLSARLDAEALPGEIFSKDEASGVFDISQVHHSNARFDMAKCTWLNQQHLRDLTGVALVDHAGRGWRRRDWNGATRNGPPRALECVKEKVSLASEFPGWTHFFFRDEFPFEPEALAKVKANSQAPQLLRALEQKLRDAAGLG